MGIETDVEKLERYMDNILSCADNSDDFNDFKKCLEKKEYSEKSIRERFSKTVKK